MESINTFYPVFEPDQVLTSTHLNQLRKYLAIQDRLSRRLLHGIGIVCGLQISNPSTDVITISKGVGITSKGFLVTLPNSVCVYYRPYEDKIYNEVNCEGEVEGKYNLFLKNDGTQYNLWELLTSEEEAEIDDNRIKPLSEATINMNNMYVILYLEIEDLDMMACFGDDCDEKGIQRNFKARKLLIAKADLLKIIEETGKYGDSVTETELEAEINAKYNLKPVSVKRLGYDFQTGAKTLSLSQYYSPNTLFQNYRSLIKQGAVDVGKALHGAYNAYDTVLEELYPENPFKLFDSENENNNLLYKKIQAEIKNDPYSIQYAYDFLNDLVAAYDEFRKAAFELVAVCCPDCRWFPRHLMLGKAIQPEIQPSIFRHRFIPSPIMNQQKELLVQVKIYFQRLVKMVEEMNLALEEFTEIKVTPSAAYSNPISKRSIPFYYNVNNTSQLYRFWSFDKTVKHQANTVLSYHAAQKYNSTDLFVSEPSFWEYKKHDFLRIEGHVGQKYETVLSNVMSQRERLNLPIKVVGVKLSRRFQNTNVDVECRFDDLENLYRMFVTELRCILVEESEFFRSLDTNLAVGGQSTGVLTLLDSPKPSDATTSSGGQEILNLLGNKSKEKKEAAPSTEKDVNKLTGGLRINTNTGKEDKLKTNTIGYMMDNVTLTAGQDVYTSILNIYATGHFNTLLPGIFIYVILYPVQIAQNIDTLLNNIPESLEELDLEVLQNDYDKLIESATGFKTTIQTNLANPEYQRIGNEEVILYRLDKLIYHCSIKKLIELYRIYLNRVEEVKKLNLFARFAKDHPGMEHMAGVPKGGTFIIVYADKNEKAPGYKHKDIVTELADRPDFLASNTGFMNFGVNEPAFGSGRKMKTSESPDAADTKEHMNISRGLHDVQTNTMSGKNLLSSGLGQLTITEQLERLGLEDIWIEAEPKDDLPPDNVVIADFALPYLCCGSCNEIATMVVTQITFRLEKSEFCRNDQKSYKFMTDPVGGRVTGPGVTSQGADYFFAPSAIAQDDEAVQFIYEINNQTVVFNAKVFNPKADFDAGEPIVLNDGSVRMLFFNKSVNAEKYLWDFGDGDTSEEFEPEHVYKNVDNPVVVVTLKAMRGECENLIVKEIELPQVQEIVFDIEPKMFCWTDENSYQFTTEPAGGTVAGPGVQNEGGTWYFKPADIGIPSGEDVEFKYTLPNGQMVKLFIKVYYPKAAFVAGVQDYDPETESVTVNFQNLSVGADTFLWDFGDGTTTAENNPVHVYTDMTQAAWLVTLKASKELCEDVFGDGIKNPYWGYYHEFAIGDKTNYCNNQQELVPFTTVPEATADNPVTGTNVVFVNGKYYFKPLGLKAGKYTFEYMDLSAEVTVLEAPPSDFEHNVVEYGEVSALVQFTYSADNIKSIAWNFGDGGNSDIPKPRHEYKDIDFPKTFTISVAVTGENSCKTQFSKTITLNPQVIEQPEVNLLLPSLKRLAKNDLSVQVFGETNALPNSMISYYTEINKRVSDPATSRNYVIGKTNTKISAKVDGYSEDIFKTINALKKTDPALAEKQALAFNFFQINMYNLIEMMSILDNDLKVNSKMMGSLQKFKEQLSALKEMGVSINPGGKLKNDLAAKRAEIKQKPVITQGIIDIESML